jgi:hypothetical protein
MFPRASDFAVSCKDHINFRVPKNCKGIYWLAEQLLVSQEGIYSLNVLLPPYA